MEVVEASSSGKRKSDEDDDKSGATTKVLVRSFASHQNISGMCSANENSHVSKGDLKIVVSGVKKKMRHYHPAAITRALTKAIGEYTDIRVLPSGDLNITCKHSKQASRLLECDTLKDGNLSIPIKASFFAKKTYGSRAVISGVPLDITETELLAGLTQYSTNAVKRLKRKVEGKYIDCLSVLLFFHSNIAPETVTFGYLHFRTKPYNPPPLRCHNCNRYGHTKDKCRGKACCSKCGSREHKYNQCNRDKKCVNCNLHHSAAYGGSPVYKEEQRIQIIRERSNVPFSKARDLYLSQKAQLPPQSTPVSHSVLSPSTETQTFSEAAKRRLSQKTLPNPTALIRSDAKSRDASHTITSPVQNDCDLRHLPNCTSMYSTLSTTGDTNARHMPIDPVRLLALVAQVVKLTISAVKSGDHDIFAIVSSATSKYLGIPTDAQSLQNSLNLVANDTDSQRTNSENDSQPS